MSEGALITICFAALCVVGLVSAYQHMEYKKNKKLFDESDHL
jgi:hypothetical protein